MNVKDILDLLDAKSKEYRELSESLVPPERTIPGNSRISAEVALEVSIALDGLIKEIRGSLGK